MTPSATGEATRLEREAPAGRLFAYPVLLARSSAMMWAVGSTLGALTFPDLMPGPHGVVGAVAIALAGFVAAALTWRFGTRLPQRYYEATNLLGIIGCGIGAALAPQLGAMLSLMLLWQGLYACSFFRGRVQVACYVAVAVAGLAGAARSDHPHVMLFGLATVAVAVVFVGSLLRALESLTLIDPLTGLANRRAWDDRVGREFARATRTGETVCIAMLDLDHFKAYNDTHGHGAGDRLLQRVASALGGAVRTEDFVARLGGEEFAVLLSCTDLVGAQTAISRLRERAGGEITSSAGVAAWDGIESADVLMARADAALYEAKSAGRDRVVAAAPTRRIGATTMRPITRKPAIARTIEVAAAPARSA